MLSEIVSAALEQAPDISIAGVSARSEDLADQVRATQVQAVVTQVAEAGDAGRFRPLLASFPTLKIIAITSDGKGGFLHEMRPWSTRLAELSAAALLAALRPSLTQSMH